VLPTVRATFSAAQGVLTVIGDAQDNTIAVSRNAAGSIFVNSGAIKVMGGTATVAKTKLIQLFGLGGNDNLSLDETNGALPKANILGGAGNDTITGSSDLAGVDRRAARSLTFTCHYVMAWRPLPRYGTTAATLCKRASSFNVRCPICTLPPI
jgi:hypothetical protein